MTLPFLFVCLFKIILERVNDLLIMCPDMGCLPWKGEGMSAPNIKGTCLVKECIELTASELKVRALTQLFSLVIGYFTYTRNSLRPD